MTDVVMPQMGESIVEGTLTRWIKKVGDRVERDEPLRRELSDFVDASRVRRPPLVDGQAGRNALELATKIAEKMESV